jgi:hypothetical protein
LPKVKTAAGLEHIQCDCGCGQTYVYLLDRHGDAFARFSLVEELWIPFAEECLRVCRGEEPIGPPQPVLQ